MLNVEQLSAGHGRGTVLHDITLHVPPGAVHAIVGANGAGKTTLVHTLAGLIRPSRGRIRLDGRDITSAPAHRRARAGIALVPQGRRVFASLTVAEHLTIAGRRPARGATSRRWDRHQVLDLLPQLAARQNHRGGQLSGGEQQMLAIARALLTQPRLLLLDEPTEGLAPTLVTQIRHLITTLAGAGLTILLTAPQPGPVAAVADHTTTLTAGHTSPPAAGHSPAAAVPDTAGHPPAGRAHQPAWTGLLPRPHPVAPATTDHPQPPAAAPHGERRHPTQPCGGAHAR